MSDFQKIKLSVVTSTTITIISSLIAGLLLAYFSDVIFRPQVLYTVSSSKITLPTDYEKEIAKVRALLMLKNFEAILKRKTTKNSLSIEAGITERKLGIKEHKLDFFVGNTGKLGNNSIQVEGADLEQMLNTVEKPEALRAILDPTISFPTAFSTIDIYNAGNREASDLEMNIIPNGVLVEALVNATEPSAEKWEDIYDEQTRLPIGAHLPPIKRLPPGGKIKVKIYWNLLGVPGETSEKTVPIVDVKGSYSGGMVKFVESKPESPINWPLWIIAGLSLCLSGAALGYWLNGRRRNYS